MAVLDNKGHFIPNIPEGQLSRPGGQRSSADRSFNINTDAPMTIAMVIEFNNLFQQY